VVRNIRLQHGNSLPFLDSRAGIGIARPMAASGEIPCTCFSPHSGKLDTSREMGNPMRKLLFCLICLLPTVAVANPNFTIGSNHFETIHAYPHDLLKWPESGVFVYWRPQTLPWQGDVTNISNRPSASYTSNYQSVEFAPPYGYSGNPEAVHSWFNVSSYAYQDRVSTGGLTTTRFGKFYFELANTSLNLELEASGVARATETTGETSTYHLVPFEGETTGSRDDYEFKLIYANQLWNNPFGFKIRYIDKNANQPGGFIRFNKEGTTYNLSHLTWGWATVGCNHIFGYSSINADAFFQNSYSVFSGHQLDLQASYELNGNHKTGLRYRTRRENGDNYTWRYNDGAEFDGNYYVDERWQDRKTDSFLRGYSKINFWKVGLADAGILFFLQYGSHNLSEINKLVASESDSRESANEFIIETNPFLNYRFHGGYFDIGLLLEYSRTGLRNTRNRWNSVSGSDQPDVLWSTEPYNGWSTSWESFSKGSKWFFATGLEADTSIGLYRRLSALLRLTLIRKYTRTEKLYGQSEIPDGGNSFGFRQTHQRNNYKNETWMTGAVGVAYGRGPIQTFLTLQLPLAYLIKQTTKLADNTEQLFEHEKRDMWQVQQPTSLRLLVVYGLGSMPKHPHATR